MSIRRLLTLFAALVLIAGASCSGGGARSREARARLDAGMPASSLATSTSASSTVSTSTTVPIPPRSSTSITSRSRAPVALGATSPAGAGGEALASWYGAESGGRTASGDSFDGSSLTFAHRTLAFGTRIQFCYGGRCVVAQCNDRGPFVAGRTFDLSRATFASIADPGHGVITVQWTVVV